VNKNFQQQKLNNAYSSILPKLILVLEKYLFKRATKNLKKPCKGVNNAVWRHVLLQVPEHLTINPKKVKSESLTFISALSR